MAQLALVQNLIIRWHHLHCLQSWPPGCVSCIATLPWIALLALSVCIELVSSSARVTSVKFHKGLSRTDGQTSGPIDRTPGLPGSDKNRVKYPLVTVSLTWVSIICNMYPSMVLDANYFVTLRVRAYHQQGFMAFLPPIIIHITPWPLVTMIYK